MSPNGAPVQLPVRGKVTLIPIVLGGTLAVLTLNVEHLSVISKSPFWGDIQNCVMSLLFPGLFGAAIIGGNIHATNVWVGAVLNGLFYFGVAWGLTALVMVRKARPRRVR